MYPEHKKLDRGGEFQAISNFVAFLEENGYALTMQKGRSLEIDIQPQKAMYRYFGVDEKKLELEMIQTTLKSYLTHRTQDS